MTRQEIRNEIVKIYNEYAELSVVAEACRQLLFDLRDLVLKIDKESSNRIKV